MSTDSTGRTLFDIVLNIAALVLFFLGMTSNLLYISGGLAVLSISMFNHPKQRRGSYLVFAVAIVYFIVVFGYGVGKDMAKRDNAVTQMPDSGGSVRVWVEAPASADNARTLHAAPGAIRHPGLATLT